MIETASKENIDAIVFLMSCVNNAKIGCWRNRK